MLCVHVPGVVHVYAHALRPVMGLLELTVKPIKFQNGVSNAVVACAPDSFTVLKYYMYTIKTI